jgi:glycosyltransferase A (GT-A) superfamily protein (DUF2064 family)
LKTVYHLRDHAEVELSLDIPCAAWSEFSVHRTVQHEGDLGVRLYSALERGLAAGRPKVLILGSDSPTLPVEHIRFLLDFDADVALGPTSDGGYYGIACRKVILGMFAGVRWSTPHAMRDTITSVERCGLTSGIGPEWFDVDTPEDLVRIEKVR